MAKSVKVPKNDENKLPNLSNATPEFLVDEIGDVRQQIKELEKKKGFYQEALLGRARLLGQTHFKGDRWEADIVELSRTGLDTQTVKEEMGEEWYAEHCKVTSYQQINTKRVPD